MTTGDIVAIISACIGGLGVLVGSFTRWAAGDRSPLAPNWRLSCQTLRSSCRPPPVGPVGCRSRARTAGVGSVPHPGRSHRSHSRIVHNAGGGEVVIHGRHGLIRDSDTVPPGNYSCPPRDKQ